MKCQLESTRERGTEVVAPIGEKPVTVIFGNPKSNGLDTPVSYCIEAGQQATGKLGEGETLGAVSKVVAARQQPRSKILINLGDQTVHTVAESRSGGKIGAVWTSGVLARSSLQRWVAEGSRNIRQRPRIAGQQRSRNRIRSSVRSYINRYLRGIGYAAKASLCSSFALSLIVQIKERMVLHDRPAQRTSKLVVVERVLSANTIEEISRAQLIGAQILQCRAVQLIRAALGDYVHNRAAVAPIF